MQNTFLSYLYPSTIENGKKKGVLSLFYIHFNWFVFLVVVFVVVIACFELVTAIYTGFAAYRLHESVPCTGCCGSRCCCFCCCCCLRGVCIYLEAHDNVKSNGTITTTFTVTVPSPATTLGQFSYIHVPSWPVNPPGSWPVS